MKVTKEVTHVEDVANVNLSQTDDGSVLVEVTDTNTGLTQVVSVVRPTRNPGGYYNVECLTLGHVFEVEPID